MAEKVRARTRKAAFVLTAVITLSGAVLTPAPAGAGGQVPTALVNLHSSKLLDVLGASHAPGAGLVQWTYNGGDNQRWGELLFGTVSGLELVVVVSPATGMVLDVAGGSTGNGAAVIQNTWSGALSQLWLVLPLAAESPHYVIINLNSGKVLDVLGASQATGAPVVQWTWHGGFNQIWTKTVFTEVS